MEPFFCSGGLYLSFGYRTRHTPCVAHFFLMWLMSEFHLYNSAHTVFSAFFTPVAYVGFLLIELGIHRM